MQNAVNTMEVFRQVRAALSVIPYSCVDAINALRMSLRDVAGYKNVCLSWSFGLLVLRWSQLLCLYWGVLLSSVFVRVGASFPCPPAPLKYSPVVSCPERMAQVPMRHKWKSNHHGLLREVTGG